MLTDSEIFALYNDIDTNGYSLHYHSLVDDGNTESFVWREVFASEEEAYVAESLPESHDTAEVCRLSRA